MTDRDRMWLCSTHTGRSCGPPMLLNGDDEEFLLPNGVGTVQLLVCGFVNCVANGQLEYNAFKAYVNV